MACSPNCSRASIMEEKMMVFHNNDAELIQSLRSHIDILENEKERCILLADKFLAQLMKYREL